MMLAPTQVWLAVEAIEMRAGIDGLSQRVQNRLGRTPCDGTAYAFRNRRQNRLKLLIWDSTGVGVCRRHLHRGHLTWPSLDALVCALTAVQWQWLIAGVNWQRLDAPPPADRQIEPLRSGD